MEPIIKSDESLFLTHPSPPKYQTNMVVRMEEAKKHKAPAETYEHHQIEKKKKANKTTPEGISKKFREEKIVTIDDGGNGEEELPN